MELSAHTLSDLEARLEAGEPFTRPDAERVMATTDLVSIGMVAEAARRRQSGDRVTFGRVVVIAADGPTEIGQAGEARIVGVPASVAEAVGWIRHAVQLAPGVPVTGFSLADLLDLIGHDQRELVRGAVALREAGLESVAEVPIDRMGSIGQLIAAVSGLVEGGLGAWRLTVERAPVEERLGLVERAAALQKATGAVRAFAPLPRLDPASVPSTGYDDVRTIAIARLLCADIPFVQVDWPLYGPKLAQVAIAFGANDVDGILPIDPVNQGARRAAAEDIARQIRSAAATPAERNGRYELRP
ncbi:MAG: hypothetical protein ABI051_06375 [Vicinamibacterales bacterium]